jgi:hypothetical protein
MLHDLNCQVDDIKDDDIDDYKDKNKLYIYIYI